MITLRVEWEAGNIRGMSVDGHSGYAPEGGDIVCAGASILMTTCINALESVAGILPEVQQDERTALMAVALPKEISGQAMHDAQIVFKTTLQGFEDLSSQYPKYVRIIDGRKSLC